ARIGFAGALLGVVMMLLGLARRAAEKGTTFAATASAGGTVLVIQAVLLALLLLLLAPLAAGRGSRRLWPLVSAATFALVLRNAVRLQWTALVNPLHVLGGGLWIGTLALLALTVIPLAVRGELAPRGAGPTLSQLVARFSSLSLGAVSLLVVTGLVTAWRHLKQLSALWTTPYGYALLAKLAVVAVVFLLGAVNWRRVTPRLGADGGAAALSRSSRAELTAAAVVLAITALLVSLPSPRAPGPPPGAPAAGAAPPTASVAGH
ncbi:MAG TPA: CopD family protein, partial [Gemmatimonadaceae bacterium]|nr:CopD family protein [Gemmatimonadaceae bacterium]